MPSTPSHASIASPGGTSVGGHASSLLSASPATYGMMTPPTSASFTANTATMSPVHHAMCDMPPGMQSTSGQNLSNPYLASPGPNSAPLQQQQQGGYAIFKTDTSHNAFECRFQLFVCSFTVLFSGFYFWDFRLFNAFFCSLFLRYLHWCACLRVAVKKKEQ